MTEIIDNTDIPVEFPAFKFICNDHADHYFDTFEDMMIDLKDFDADEPFVKGEGRIECQETLKTWDVRAFLDSH